MFYILLNLNGHFKTMQQKLNTFKSNVKLLNISGVITSENINSNLRKAAPLRTFQTLSLLLFTSMITLQFLTIYNYRGNISLMADCIGFIAVFAAQIS